MRMVDSLRRILSSELSSKSIPSIGSVGRYAISPSVDVVGWDEDSTRFFRNAFHEMGVRSVMPRMMSELWGQGYVYAMVGHICPDCGMDVSSSPGGSCRHPNIRFDRALIIGGPAIAFTGAGVFVRSLSQIRELADGDETLSSFVDSMLSAPSGVVGVWKDQAIRIDPRTVCCVGDPGWEGCGEAECRRLVEDWIGSLMSRAASARGLQLGRESAQIVWGRPQGAVD